MQPTKKLSSLPVETTIALTDRVINVKNAAGGDVLVTLQNFINALGAASSNPYKFSVYRAAAMNSSSSFAKVVFDTELYDTSGNFDTANSRFIAPVDGFYHFSALAGNTAAGSTPIQTKLYKNGSEAKDGSYAGNGTANGAYSHASGDIQLAAGEYVEVWFVGGSGSVVGVDASTCYFDGHLISKT